MGQAKRKRDAIVREHIALLVQAATWRDAVWNLVGSLALHPLLALRAFRSCYRSDAEVRRYIKIDVRRRK